MSGGRLFKDFSFVTAAVLRAVCGKHGATLFSHTFWALQPALHLSPDVHMAKRLKLLWTPSQLNSMKLPNIYSFLIYRNGNLMWFNLPVSSLPPVFLPKAQSLCPGSLSAPPAQLVFFSQLSQWPFSSCAQRCEWE